MRINQDLSKVEPAEERTGGWTVKPDGWYRVIVLDEPVYKPTARGDGFCLHVKMNHLDPRFPSDFEMHFLTLQHPKQDTQEIAQRELKALAEAIEHLNPDLVMDSNELVGLPFFVRLYSQVETDQGRLKYADSNGMVQRVGGFRSVKEHEAKGEEEGQTGQAPAARQQAAAPPLPIGDDAPF